MTAPDAAEKLDKIKAIVDAWQADGVQDQNWQHHFNKLEDIADIISDKTAPSPAQPKPADEFERDVRAVVAALVDGTDSDAPFLLGDPSNRLLDAREYGAMPAGDLAVELAYLLRESGRSDVGVHGAAGLCILALVGRRMAAREAAMGGR